MSAAAKTLTIPKAIQGLPTTVQHALMALNPQRRKFVVMYCGRANGNQTLAAQFAGVKGSIRSQAAIASQWMTDRSVRHAIEQWMTAFALSAAQLTWGIGDLAHANIGPFFERDPLEGSVRIKKNIDSEDWEAHKHWIKSVRMDPETGNIVSLELHDALAARALLSKILKLHSDAPIINYNYMIAQMSDEEVMKALDDTRDQINTPQLPPGERVADIAAPVADEVEVE